MHGEDNSERQEEQEWIEHFSLNEESHCHRRKGCLAPIDLSSHVDISRSDQVRIAEKHGRRQDEGFCSLRGVGDLKTWVSLVVAVRLGQPLLDPDLVSTFAQDVL